MPSLMSFTSLFFFKKVFHLRCPTFKVSILEETRRFGNVSLKLNVTSSKNENGEYATDGMDSLFGGEVVMEGQWQGLGRQGQLPSRDRWWGNYISIFFPDQG